MTDPLSGMYTDSKPIPAACLQSTSKQHREEVTSTGGLLLKRMILTTVASKVNDVVLSPYYCIINTMLRRGKHNWNRCYVKVYVYFALSFALSYT